MKRKLFAMLLSAAMVFTMLPAASIQAEESIPAGMVNDAAQPAPTVDTEIDPGAAPEDNLARSAMAAAAYTNTYGISTDRINDGTLANATASTSWNCWGAADSQYPMWASLTWDQAQTISSMRVMWWSDGGGVAFPSGAEVEYLDGENWVKISDVGIQHGGTNGADGVWNIVNFGEQITTASIRMLISRNGSGSTGIGISEWEVYAQKMKERIAGLEITGTARLNAGEEVIYTGKVLPERLAEGTVYEWSVTSEDNAVEIQGGTDKAEVSVKAIKNGQALLQLKATKDGVTVEADYSIRVVDESVTSVDEYITSTAAGMAPILPNSVVGNGPEFDEPTPATAGSYNFGETFHARLIPVEWEAVDAGKYATAGTEFTVNGTASYGGKTYPATARVKVNAPVTVSAANSSVTFENVQVEDEFWTPRQEINATTSLDKAIAQIAEETGGEPNFDNAIKKLNGESYSSFQGFVFQDSDIYKSIEAISYTLSATQNDTSEEVAAQRKKLEDKLDSWIGKIEKVQYADGYIDTYFTLRGSAEGGGPTPIVHRWKDLARHEMYNAGHLLEGVVAYTRYHEGIGDPDYRLYVVGKRFADEIVTLFGPGGTRHEVPGHEEIELALVKFGKLVEEYEGQGTGQSYFDTAKVLIDRRGNNYSERESGYYGGTYSQDATPFKEETNAVGHAVRANYFYTGVTDIATLLPEGDADRDAYISSLGTIWDSVTTKKTYITGGIGATTANSDAEGFGADYDLPPDQSYIEICAAIAAANWNQRMNLLHEDGKYADMMEKNLYNSILVGENLDGNRFFYSSKLRVDGGNGRSEWFGCACCPPNLMRTIATLGGYMYTVHDNDVFVNMFVGSSGTVKVNGTQIGIKQETKYPWDGKVEMTVTPAEEKAFAMKLRIPGWVNEQKNKTVTIKVNGEAVTAAAEKGYVTLNRTWKSGDKVSIDIPMEIRMTESDPNVKATEGMIALQRGPIVYCMEKAGNAQLNTDIEDFDPLQFVIPRDAELKAEYNPELLNGVVEITGDVKYATGRGKEMIDAKLQAVPYYAWNNRGDGAEYIKGSPDAMNRSTKMLIWTMADEPIVKTSELRNYAAPSVNYTGWGMGADRFADGDTGTFWNGHSDPNLQTQNQWMMYDFGERKANISASDIMFHDDGSGVKMPLGITIEYMTDDGQWAEVAKVGDWSFAFTAETYNTYEFEPVTTSKIRVTMDHYLAGTSKVAVSVREWNLKGALAASAEEIQELSDVVAQAKGFNKSDYTEDSWSTLQKALAAAEEVLQKQNPDLVSEIVPAQNALEEAIRGLVGSGGNPPAEDPDKKPAAPESIIQLTTAVTAAKDTYKADKYTAESWSVYSAALLKAENVTKKDGVTQKEIDDAKKALEDAIARLKEKPTENPPTEDPDKKPDEPGKTEDTTQPRVKEAKLTLGVKETFSVYKKGYTYASSNKKYVTVSRKGVIKGIKKGKADITVKNASGKAVQIYHVTVKKAPGKISKVSPAKKTLKKGKSVTIKVTLPKGTASRITFTTSNKKVATVSAKGVVKAKKKGKATITVKTFNKKTKKVKITVIP